MVLRPVNDGGGDPVSKYDYHKLTLEQLQAALSVHSKPAYDVRDAWKALAGNLADVLSNLSQDIGILSTWQSKATGPFTERAKAIYDYGQQLANAAHQANESFNDPSGAFHTSAWFLGLSIDDMNAAHTRAENARAEWSADISTLVNYLATQYANNKSSAVPGQYHQSDQPGGAAPPRLNGGYATWVGNLAQAGTPGQYYVVSFDYVYGYGKTGYYPGIVMFSGQLRCNDYSADISAQNCFYGPRKLTARVGYEFTDENWAADNFPDSHRDQLATLLNQQAGSGYAPLVGKFPVVPRPSWVKDMHHGNGGNNTNTPPNYPWNGSTGLPPASSGSTGLPGIPGGSSGTAGTMPGLPGAGTSGSAGAPGSGIPFAGSAGSGQAGSLPPLNADGSTHLAGFTPPSLGTAGGTGGFAPAGLGGHAGGIGAGGVGGGLGSGGTLGHADGLSGGLGADGGLGAGGTAASGGLAGTAGAAGRSGMPMMPPMMPPGAGNQDKERQRKSWLPEDEDIWGTDTDTDTVPPVISGEP